ncbi:MAG: hypothetical protein FWC50_02535 [Planctomycetaceae bacterium]|nr:hypothetical protein [Planctomycetaceae bacterium]
MNFNFFDWIRDGVKRSVLMGVTDAVDQMGMPADEESSKDKILSFLQSENQSKLPTQSAPVRRRLPGGTASPARKLGRSIAEIHQE